MRTISTEGDLNADWIRFAALDDFEALENSALANAMANASKKGKPCGESFIDKDLKCHVGDGEPPQPEHKANALPEPHPGSETQDALYSLASGGRYNDLKMAMAAIRKRQPNNANALEYGGNLMKIVGDGVMATDKSAPGLAASKVSPDPALFIRHTSDHQVRLLRLSDGRVYHIPAHFFRMNWMPVTASGKPLGPPDSKPKWMLKIPEKKTKAKDAAPVESYQEKKLQMNENTVDREMAAFVYDRILEKAPKEPDGSVQCHEGVAFAEKLIANFKSDSLGWKSRVRVYEWDEEKWQQVSDALDSERWPTKGPVADLVADIRDGSVNGHSWIKIGKFTVDPYLWSVNVGHNDISEFTEKMARVYESVGIHPRPLDRSLAVKPGIKSAATTGDILGGTSEWTQANEDQWYQQTFFKDKPETKPFSKWKSAGAVVFRDDGKIALRKVAGGYGGYSYSWAKGQIEEGEGDEKAAEREVLEEQGHSGKIVDDLGMHEGTSSHTRFFLMKHEADHPDKMDKETEKVEWLSPEEIANKLDSVRDLLVLLKAVLAMQKHIKPAPTIQA